VSRFGVELGNHIFFVYSLINAKIATPEKCEAGGEQKEQDRYKQLFISTHNLDFMKYLKRLPGVRNKNKSEHLIINRRDKVSDISMMFKLGQCAQSQWRRLRGFRQFARVIEGVEFRVGIEVRSDTNTVAAG